MAFLVLGTGEPVLLLGQFVEVMETLQRGQGSRDSTDCRCAGRLADVLARIIGSDKEEFASKICGTHTVPVTDFDAVYRGWLETYDENGRIPPEQTFSFIHVALEGMRACSSYPSMEELDRDARMRMALKEWCENMLAILEMMSGFGAIVSLGEHLAAK